MKTQWHVVLSLAGGALLSVPNTGCLMYRANALEATPIEEPMRVAKDTGFVARKRVTVWSLVYGLAMKGQSRIKCDGAAGLQDVTITSPPHYTLLTIITLGAVSPKRLQAKCAKTIPAGGDFLRPPAGGN